MPYFDIIWIDDEEDGNIQHIARHGLTPQEVEAVIADPVGEDVSESTGRPIYFGYTPDGRFIAVVYELIDETTIYPMTAFEVDDDE